MKNQAFTALVIGTDIEIAIHDLNGIRK